MSALFEVAILEHPTKEESEAGALPRLVLPPTAVIAKNANSAAVNVVMDGAAKDIDKDRMEVIVRHF